MSRPCFCMMAASLIASAFASPSEAARPTPGSIGVNLNGLYSSGEQIPFVDVFKMSSAWSFHVDGLPADRVAPELDENGWVSRLDPGVYAETTIFTGSGGHYPAGQYTLFYQGNGTLTVSGDGVKIVKASPGHILLDVKPAVGANNGIRIRETGTDPAQPIKNIRVFLPGFSAEPKGNPFNPPFLDVLRPFKVVRFVGWAHEVRSETTEWRDERPETYATQASNVGDIQKMSGVSLEYQIQLANLLHEDPWFLVPLKANDEFVRKMAALVHDRLDPSLHPYVELCNEIWNTHFPEGNYARQMGLKLAMDNDPAKAGAKWYSGQALHMFDIWNGVYGADAPRIVKVLAGAYSVPPLTGIELAYQDAYKHIDVFAIAPYIAPKILDDYSGLSEMKADEVLDHVQTDITDKFRKFMSYHLAYTKKYGVDLVAYEGGPGLMSPGAPPALLPHIDQTLLEATHSQRMAALYRTLLDEWFQMGGTLFNHFDDCSPANPWGNFGLVDYQYQDPKTSVFLQMLAPYIASHRAAAMLSGTPDGQPVTP